MTVKTSALDDSPQIAMDGVTTSPLLTATSSAPTAIAVPAAKAVTIAPAALLSSNPSKPIQAKDITSETAAAVPAIADFTAAQRSISTTDYFVYTVGFSKEKDLLAIWRKVRGQLTGSGIFVERHEGIDAIYQSPESAHIGIRFSQARAARDSALYGLVNLNTGRLTSYHNDPAILSAELVGPVFSLTAAGVEEPHRIDLRTGRVPEGADSSPPRDQPDAEFSSEELSTITLSSRGAVGSLKVTYTIGWSQTRKELSIWCKRGITQEVHVSSLQAVEALWKADGCRFIGIRLTGSSGPEFGTVDLATGTFKPHPQATSAELAGSILTFEADDECSHIDLKTGRAVPSSVETKPAVQTDPRSIAPANAAKKVEAPSTTKMIAIAVTILVVVLAMLAIRRYYQPPMTTWQRFLHGLGFH